MVHLNGAISTRLKILYGSGQAINAVVDATINTFLLFYLTAVCGMSGSAAGTIFLIALVVDGMLDPFIGRLSDQWQSRWGRRLPFMVVAIPMMSIALVLMFSIPSGIGKSALFSYVLALNILLRVGTSIFALPHSALNAELTDDYGERSVLSTYRALFLVLGTAAVLIPAFSIIFAGQGGLQAHEKYPSFGLMVGVLLIVFGALCVLGIAKDVLKLPRPARVQDAHNSTFVSEIMQLFRNPSFVLLFGGAVLVLVGQGLSTSIALHAFRYFWKLPNAVIQLPLLVLPLGMLVGTLVAGALLKRIEKRDGVIGALVLITVYPITIVALAFAGLVTPGSLLATILVVGNGAIFGACGAMCFVCFYSMIADAVDEHDHRFGVRREALYAAALMLGAKAATGIGGFIAGLGLQLVGFSAPADGGVVAVSATTAAGLGILWGPGSSLLGLCAIPLFLRYRLTRTAHAQIMTGLAERRSTTPIGLPGTGGSMAS